MQVSSDDVIQKLRGVKPKPIRTLAVTVEGVSYPVKQAFSVVTEVDIADFDSYVARRLFRRLGFKVERIEKD